MNTREIFLIIWLALVLHDADGVPMTRIFQRGKAVAVGLKRKPVPYLHATCRNKDFVIERFHVPDNLVKWDVKYPAYKPIFFESSKTAKMKHTDPSIGTKGFHPKWNSKDGDIDRASFHGPYIIQKKFPLNVGGRTGISGKGWLKRYGPNHMIDVIITRWKVNANGKYAVDKDGKRILELLHVQHLDGTWTVVRDDLEPRERVFQAVIRIIFKLFIYNAEIKKFFEKVSEILLYGGYVDHPDNTDNAWVESSGYRYHDELNILKDGVLRPKNGEILNIEWKVTENKIYFRE